jgi:hypothetical protein
MSLRVRSSAAARAVVHTLLGVAVAVVMTGTAVAVTDTHFSYSTKQTGYVSVSPMDLAPVNSAAAQSGYDASAALSSPSFRCYQTGIHLPDDSRLTRMETSYQRGTSSDVVAFLLRTDLATSSIVQLASHSPADDSDVTASIATSVPSVLRVVDNEASAFGYRVCVGLSTVFHGARLTYTYTSAGD